MVETLTFSHRGDTMVSWINAVSQRIRPLLGDRVF